MQLTLQTDLGLRVLMHLSVHDGSEWITVREIAERQRLSLSHLLKVAQALSHHRYVVTKRGISGGLRLALRPDEVRIGDVVRKLEPNLGLVECMREEEPTCVMLPICKLRRSLDAARSAFLEVLDGLTLADCIHDPRAAQKLLVLGSRRAPAPRGAGAHPSPPPRDAGRARGARRA